MVTRTPVQMIEDHSEQITERVVRRIRHNPDIHEIKKLPESELRDRASEVVKNLGHWLSASHSDELATRYERLGRHRFEEGIPLHEVVRCLHILRANMIDFVREQGVMRSSIDLYAEGELEHRVGSFFDDLVFHVVRGYEGALREAARRSG